MKKRDRRRTFVATIEGQGAGRDVPVVIRLLRANSLRQVIDRLVKNGDLRGDFFGPEGKYGRDGRLTTDEKVVEYCREVNDYGADVLTIDEFIDTEAERGGRGRRLVGIARGGGR